MSFNHESVLPVPDRIYFTTNVLLRGLYGPDYGSSLFFPPKRNVNERAYAKMVVSYCYGIRYDRNWDTCVICIALTRAYSVYRIELRKVGAPYQIAEPVSNPYPLWHIPYFDPKLEILPKDHGPNHRLMGYGPHTTSRLTKNKRFNSKRIMNQRWL